jgi:hypothetical protein
MANYLPRDNINKLINLINTNNNKISDLMLEINRLKLDNEKVEEMLRNGCNHNRVINHNMMSERTEFMCSICNLDL